MKVNELFYSIQGEGARAGEPSVFVRLAGCNLTCGFCDTEFASGQELNLDEIRAYITEHWPEAEWIVWTGGEPTEQLTELVVAYFKAAGFKQAIETNGTRQAPAGLDWVCCSPKVAEHVLAKSFPNGVDELRYVRHAGQLSPPSPSITAKRYFLSPMFDGNQVNVDNLKHCIKLCLEHPRWSLSLQLHKLIKVL